MLRDSTPRFVGPSVGVIKIGVIKRGVIKIFFSLGILDRYF